MKNVLRKQSGDRGAALARRAGCVLQKNHLGSELSSHHSSSPGRRGQRPGGSGGLARRREARGRRPGLLPARGARARHFLVCPAASASAPGSQPCAPTLAPLCPCAAGARPHPSPSQRPGSLSGAASPSPRASPLCQRGSPAPPLSRGVRRRGPGRSGRGNARGAPRGAGRPRASSLRARRPPVGPAGSAGGTAVPGRREQARPAPGLGGTAPGPGCGGARGGTALNALDSPAPARPRSPLTAGGFVFSSHPRPRPRPRDSPSAAAARRVRPREPGPRRSAPSRGCGAETPAERGGPPAGRLGGGTLVRTPGSQVSGD